MPKFPHAPPAARLAALGPERVTLPAGTELWRIYFRGGAHPVRWGTFRAYGPTNSRFDHHLEPSSVQDRKIVYLAAHGPTCVAEAFQHTRLIDRRARTPWLVRFALGRAVTLLDLTGAWPTRAGASMAINSGPRPRARGWSRAIYAAFPDIEGLLYGSSMHANRPAVALYGRAEDAVPKTPLFNRPLADPALLRPLRNAAADLGYGLL